MAVCAIANFCFYHFKFVFVLGSFYQELPNKTLRFIYFIKVRLKTTITSGEFAFFFFAGDDFLPYCFNSSFGTGTPKGRDEKGLKNGRREFGVLFFNI